MLRVRPVPLRHAMSCGCAVILCSVSVCLSVCATLPPFVGLQLGNTTSDRPEAWPMMRESCKVTRKQVHLNNFEYAGGKNKHTHTHTHARHSFQRKNNLDHPARHRWSSWVPHCTYAGMSSLCACIGCMRMCSLSPLSFRGGGVLPVVDLRVEVTVEDVIEGKQSSSWE